MLHMIKVFHKAHVLHFFISFTSVFTLLVLKKNKQMHCTYV